MKNLVPIFILGIIALCGLFYAFTDSSESEFLGQLRESKTIIANQNACIDDIEASLYDFSSEISALRSQNEFLIQENENLRTELRIQANKAAELRSEMVAYEEYNYNLKRQLDQVLIGREIRARHETNNAELIIADNATDVNALNENEKILDMQAQISENETEIEKRADLILEIEDESKETIAEIEANEAKIDFNIELEPASDPNVEFNDPLVSNTVLYQGPADAPRLFSELEMQTEDIAAVPSEDEFTSKSPIYSLIENTNVIYNYIACRNDRYGRKIKRLKKDARNWNYTFIQFNLDTENNNLLLNKEFRVRLLSTDLNTYVNFHTDLIQEAASHYDFVYEGEPIKMSIYNNEVKGKSFDIQIFHLDEEGEEYLLEDDQKQLFQDGINLQTSLASKLPK